MKKTLSRLRTAGILVLAGILFGVSCKKDDKDNQPEKLTEEQLEHLSEVSNEISAGMQTAALSFYSKALEYGFTGEIPGMGGKKSGTSITTSDFDWHGPDAQGWYYRSWEYLYKYTEKLRERNDTIEHIYTLEATDGSYKHETETKHIKYIKNDKELYKGYTRIDVNSFGYNNISTTLWKMEFKDWDPTTGAGIFDWYWGVPSNLGGNTVRTHKYLHIEATPTTNNWLHVRVIIYDESGNEAWDYEYDTPFEPVDIPE